MQVKDYEKKYLPEILELEKKNFPNPWTEAQYIYETESNEFSSIKVLLDEDKVIGYICYWIIFDQGSINKICIDEAYRNKHLGTMLMLEALKDMEDQECLVVTLEVRISNAPAIKLYENMSFKTVTVKRGYYDDGEDALYMVRGVIV